MPIPPERRRHRDDAFRDGVMLAGLDPIDPPIRALAATLRLRSRGTRARATLDFTGLGASRRAWARHGVRDGVLVAGGIGPG